MKYLTALLVLLIFPITIHADEKKDKDCRCAKECIDDCKMCDDCRDCRIKRSLEKRRKLAAEEAKRRKDRLMDRGRPRVIIVVRPAAPNRGNGIIFHHHRHHHSFDRWGRWGSGYPRYRSLYRGIYRTRAPSYRTYRDRSRSSTPESQRRPRVWYDGLRTRTD